MQLFSPDSRILADVPAAAIWRGQSCIVSVPRFRQGDSTLVFQLHLFETAGPPAVLGAVKSLGVVQAVKTLACGVRRVGNGGVMVTHGVMIRRATGFGTTPPRTHIELT